jgi:hypothetical protein
VPWAGCLSILLALLCCRSVVRGGDILQVDTVWGPRPPGLEGGFYAPISLLQHVSSLALGTVATSRIYVIGAVALCAYGPMLVLRSERWWVRVLAGCIGAFNPWVYERLADGQWTVVAAAGSLFLWIAALVSLLRTPRRPALVRTVLAGVLAVAFSAHMLAMLVVLAICAALATRIWRDPIRSRWLLLAVAGTGVLLLYGAIPFFFGSGAQSYARVQTFGSADLAFFRSADDPHLGLLANLLGLQGYWAERVQRFVVAGDGPLWAVSIVVMVALALAGAWAARERAWLLAAGLVGVAISAGSAVPGVLDAAAWLVARFPLLGSFREPEKWSALWLVAVAVLVPLSVARLPRLLGAVAFAALLVPAVGVLVHLPESLAPSSYPADWTAAAAYLDAHAPPGDRVVVLPWHLYEAFAFTGSRVVENPAPVVFPGDLLVSEDPEVPGGATVSSPGGLAAAAADPDKGCDLAGAVRAIKARWVVVEPVLEGPNDATALQRCGFTLATGGGRGGVAVLRDQGGGGTASR